jgi:membrane associated rhomboid family serine protease
MSSDDRMITGTPPGANQGSWDDEPEPNQRIRLLKGGAIVLEPEGFRIIETRGLKRSPELPYESITHLAVTARALLVATMSGLFMIRTSDFPDPERGPEQARQALLARLAARPDAEFALQRVEHLEALGTRKKPTYAIWVVVALCLLTTVMQLRDSMVSQYGSFVPELFARGELWRAVTAHFIHGNPMLPIHLAMNVGGLLVLGHLVERPLGMIRTIVVLAIGGVGTILGSIYSDYQEVVGASGLVSALAGAMLALEFHHPDSLPAYWRLPRRLFIWALVIQFAIIDQVFSTYLAGGAHLGGFVAGYGAIWLVGSPGVEGAQPSTILRFAALTAVFVVVVGLATPVPLARHDEEALERHALRLLNAAPTLGIQHDNAVAWFIATEGESSASGLHLAVALADRAANATGRMDPNVLDTLAEALFQAGDRLAALLTIDEAIRLAPLEPYFREQRRRFTGERDPDDRPMPPSWDGSGEAGEDPDDRFPIDPDSPAITL